MAIRVRRLPGFVAVLLAWMPLGGAAATGTIQDVRHVVILVQENRSFDDYFGSMAGVRGFEDRTALLLPTGNSSFYQPQVTGTGYVLPFPTSIQCLNDQDHGWTGLHGIWHGGRCDAWVPWTGPTCLAYYARQDLAYYYALADAYTICDAKYCSVMGPTFPNRLCLFTGMIDPQGTGGGPAIDNTVPTNGYTWTTYPERLQAAGISWRVYDPQGDWFGNALAWFAQYRNAAPGTPLHDCGMVTVTNVVKAFQDDVTNGTLPSVSWIVPTWNASEHPANSAASGQVFVKALLDALASNPDVLNSTVFIITYDENGGFFDHLPPPVPPPGTPDEFVGGLPIGLGFRVPMILVSPWTRGGRVCSQVFDHTSILRFLESWTGVPEPNISAWRRRVCGDLTSAFDFAHPDTNYPALPGVAPVSCPAAVAPVVPTVQVMATQEFGIKLAMPLPYQPDIVSAADCGSGQFLITMTNAGTACVHLSIYPRIFATNYPSQYDVDPGASVSDSFPVNVRAGGAYDLICYGPNGFLRRFTGHVTTNCNQIEVTSISDSVAGGVTLLLTNSAPSTVNFTVSSGYPGDTIRYYSVAPGGTVTDFFAAVTNNNGWYDLTATADIDPAFVRRFAGHVETGSMTAVGKVPVVIPPPMLTAAMSGPNLVLTYPGDLSSYTLQSNSDLSTGAWSNVNLPPVLDTNGNWDVTIPMTPDTRFFRLHP